MANILFDVGHPADLHLFRNAAQRLQARGHTIHFSALDREMILDLLKHYELPFSTTYKRQGGRLGLLHEIPVRTWHTLQTARDYKTDIFVSIANPIVGLVAQLLRKPYLVMGDTEPAYNQLAMTLPFLTQLLTPDVFYRQVGRKQRRYRGYHELAYLHPDCFTPDPSIFEAIGLKQGTPYTVVRFVAWNALHDVRERGFSTTDRLTVVRELSQHGAVVISSEAAIPAEFSEFIIDYPIDRMHDLLAFAQLYVGEGNSMASEAAVLGTPAIRVNSMDLGYCRDLQARGLMFQLLDTDAIIGKIHEIMSKDDPKAIFQEHREALLNDKVPTTDVIVQQTLQLCAHS